MQKSMLAGSSLSQTVIDFTDFQSGMNGWTLKYWLPPGREIAGQIIESDGFVTPNCFEIAADGRDDDGVFFLQKNLTADIEGPFRSAAIAWALKDPGIGGTTSWPRVVYMGVPQDLAQREMQKKFSYFRWMEGLSTCPTCSDWYGHVFRADFDPGINELQICIGWKINWETKRRVLVDNIFLQAG